ncbi:hypothetical protein LTR86_000073 [Recurvomyces mirabilis]|nr:hypothetical protein LTR86_000073 [Recurvomyces mirabilis]
MASLPHLRLLFFDVFGTSILKSWFELGGKWNESEDDFIGESKAKHGSVDWREVDLRRIESLRTLLAGRGLIKVNKKGQAEEGSLFYNVQLDHLGRVWHRLPPWPDTCRGLSLLNSKFTTVALSNTYNDLLQSLVAHSNIPFTHVFSADMFDSFKPNPKVYLGASERLGMRPDECALVAAHLGDLQGAKACGFRTIYLKRPLEEKNLELQHEDIVDLVIEEHEEGFITVAKLLGLADGAS